MLELHLDRLLNRCPILDLKELFGAKAKHTGYNIGRKSLDLGVQVADTTVVKATRCLNFVLGVNQFLL